MLLTTQEGTQTDEGPVNFLLNMKNIKRASSLIQLPPKPYYTKQQGNKKTARHLLVSRGAWTGKIFQSAPLVVGARFTPNFAPTTKKLWQFMQYPMNVQLLRGTARRTPNLRISINREQDQEITLPLQTSQPVGRADGKHSLICFLVT